MDVLAIGNFVLEKKSGAVASDGIDEKVVKGAL
jgi:hypothetical protein